MSCLIELNNVSRVYSNGKIQVDALKNINFNVNKGEVVSIIGESGSGKSTLLNLLGGLDTATSGNIIINGIEIGRLSDKKLSKYRGENVGFIFQFFNLIPYFNVEENILLQSKIVNMEVEEDYKNEIINILGLKDRLNHTPSELSGGQQQRVAIARALINKPSIILADEPTGNLDSKNTKEVMELLKLTAKKFNQTLLIVTHDLTVASIADRVITMKDGEILLDEVKNK